MSALTKLRLFSKSLGMCVTVNVVLPVRKDFAPDQKLPVLWLLHGAYGCHSDWLRLTSVVRYAAPYGLAIVMPSAHNSGYTDMAHGQKFYTYISAELPSVLPTMLNLSTKREDNYIAGLSMGGAGSLMIGLSHPEKYAAIGCLSAGAINAEGNLHNSPRRLITFGDEPIKGTYKDPLGCAQNILDQKLPCPRIYHACGNEDFLLPSAHKTRDFFQNLPGNPFDYQYVEDPGAHTWEFWDAHIKEFIEFLNLPKQDGIYI
ncbi:MAG: alpha/beta hydrolase family protein [Clostridia bacterium]|nr:alpha/beta hydrolase family protein [Clostridia bacterium]